jgi:protein-L-isoaspartate(D-aspartate) O-methyltransferase
MHSYLQKRCAPEFERDADGPLRDWRSLIPWRRKEAQPMPPDDPRPGQGQQVRAFGRDESVDRMEFLLSLRRRGMSDAAVLRAMDAVPREAFVLPAFAASAYADRAMPIACGQTISQPYVVAYMTEQLEVQQDHRVLEIGTGSGYQAAILSQLAGEVYSVERYRTLAETARATLERHGYHNVTVIASDGLHGLAAHAPYDRIIVTAAAETIPPALLDQLAEGGILVLPLGRHDDAQRIVKLTRTADGVTQQDLIWVRFVPLLPGQAREL